VGARTEHLDLRLDRTGAARVEWVEHLGDQNHLHLRIGEHQITTLTQPDTPFKSGDQVSVALLKPLYFDGQGGRLRGAL
jgi:multiple sugar transport system ATP-binding protein